LDGHPNIGKGKANAFATPLLLIPTSAGIALAALGSSAQFHDAARISFSVSLREE
jgi:hypothetical protein